MKRHLQLACTAALLSLLPYGFGLKYGFVYDDHAVIEENGFLQQPRAWLKALTLQTLLDPRVPDSGRPVTILTYAFDRSLWNLRPLGYHLTNLMLHALVVLLVYTFAWRLTASWFLAWVGAVLFGLHPIALEVVQSPAFREDMLVTIGVLGFLLARNFGTAVLGLFVALGSKESGVLAVPLLLWLWACFPDERTPCAAWNVGMGLVATAGFLCAWAYAGTFQALSSSVLSPPLPIPTNFWTAPWLFIRLLRFLIWPHPLRADHVIEAIRSPTDMRFIVGSWFMVLWAAMAIGYRRRQPVLGFTLGWFLLTFFPTSNVIPLHNPFAERYGYLPLVGYALMGAWLISRLSAAKWRRLAPAVISAAYALGIVLPLRAWKDDFSLWQRVLAYEPQSARAWTWTGLELKRRGLREEALAHFQRAQEICPSDVSALINIAIVHGEEGRVEEAERLLRIAVERRPDKAEAWWNLAVCLHQQGRALEAWEAAERARSCNPYFAPPQQFFSEPLPTSAIAPTSAFQ